MATHGIGNTAVYAKAREAVVNELHLNDFIDKQWANIESRLLDAESRAAAADSSAGQSANVVFFAECLPYAAAIVHTGSTLQDFVTAKKWAEDQHVLRFADAVSVLAVLTFFYLVEKGISSGENRDAWQEIKHRVDALLTQQIKAQPASVG
jgi:hypothetical protein